jgi:hypothetical protein
MKRYGVFFINQLIMRALVLFVVTGGLFLYSISINKHPHIKHHKRTCNDVTLTESQTNRNKTIG